MRRSRELLALSVFVAAGCGAAPPPAPVVVDASVAAPAPAPSPAPAPAPPVEVSIAETHRFYVAESSLELPVLDPKLVEAGLAPAVRAILQTVERDWDAYTKAQAIAFEAENAFERCTIDPTPQHPCAALEAKASSTSANAYKTRSSFELDADTLDGRLDDAASGQLTRAWLADLRASMDPMGGTPPAPEVSFVLGERATGETTNDSYDELPPLLPVSAPAGVTVRVRAAAHALVVKNVDTAIALLEEAKTAAAGGELTEVNFLLGQAHGMRVDDAAATERAFEDALGGPASSRVSRSSVATALALAAYRAGDFRRALDVALDVSSGRIGDAPGSANAANLAMLDMLIGGMMSFDGTTTDLLEIEASSIERIGVDRVDLSKAGDAEKPRIQGELALRALYVGDIARAAKIVADATAIPGHEAWLGAAEAELCRRKAHPHQASCAPPAEAPPELARDSGAPMTLREEVERGAASDDPSSSRRVAALTRLCVEPLLVGFVAERGEHDAREISLEVKPGKTPVVIATAKAEAGTDPTLEAVAACMTALGPERFAGTTDHVVATIDLSRAGERDTSSLATLGALNLAAPSQEELFNQLAPPAASGSASSGGGAAIGGIGGLNVAPSAPRPAKRKTKKP